MEGNVTIGTRVNHENLGEGMITKVTKEEYEVLFMSGNKRMFPINGYELMILSNVMVYKPKAPEIPEPTKVKTSTTKKKKEEKKEQTLPEKPINKPNPNTNLIIENIVLEEQNISIGSRVNHKEYGEGMVNKITITQYEVLFMDGKKIKFSKGDNELTSYKNIVQKSTKAIADKKDTNAYKMSFKQKLKAAAKIAIPTTKPTPEIKEEEVEQIINQAIEENTEYTSGTKINHKILGEGIINKVEDKYYEVVFLDGKKSRYLKTDKNLTPVIDEDPLPIQPIEKDSPQPNIKAKAEKKEIEIENISIKDNHPKDEIITAKKDTKKGKTYLSTGSRIYHKVKGEGMIAKIKDNEYEVIFMDGSIATYVTDDTNLSLLNDEELNNTSKSPAPDNKSKPENYKPTTTSNNTISLGNRWKGGTLILKPLNSSLQKKEYTIESFFQIIFSIYKRVASLEEIINNNNLITQQEKQDIQMQIKAINRSLVAFNMLFKDREDYFNEK